MNKVRETATMTKTPRAIARSFNLIAATLMCLASSATAKSYLIEGAMVHTLGKAGVLASGSVWIENGRIRAVGEKNILPANAKDVERVDGRGKILTPGFFDAYSQLGVVEIPSVGPTRDSYSSLKDVTASFNVVEAFNPASTVIPVTRVEGLTRVLCAPTHSPKLFGGFAAVVELSASRDFMVKPASAMVLTLGEDGASTSKGSRAASVAQFKEAMTDVRDFILHKNEFDQARRRKYSFSRRDLEALALVYQGQVPLLTRAHRASDIDAVLRLKREFPSLKWILLGASEGWMRGKELASAKIPVIIEPLVNNPYRFEKLGATLENAARLEKAGVTLAFTYGDDPHNSRALRYAVGNAVAYGLSWDEALKGVTLNPAKIFGVKDYGALEPGQEADVVLWSGDPFEVTTVAERVWIRGKDIPMITRQTKLRDRYKNLTPSVPHAYLYDQN